MSDDAKPQPHRSPLSGWLLTGGLIVLLGAAGVLLFGPATARAPNAARRTVCNNHLRQIALALHGYRDEHGSFPPAVTYGPDGTPWHSWRVLILRHLDRPALAREYRLDEPWDGPHNRRFAAGHDMPDEFRCPADDDAEDGTTSYVAVTGDGTMWPPAGSVGQVPDPAGTLHVVEMSDSGIGWTEPRDLSFGRMAFTVNAEAGEGIRSRHTAAANVAFADGRPGFLDQDSPPETVKSLLLRVIVGRGWNHRHEFAEKLDAGTREPVEAPR